MTAPADSILARGRRLSRGPPSPLRAGVWWGFAFALNLGGRVSGSSSRPAYRSHSVSADTSASGAEDVQLHTEPAQRVPPDLRGPGSVRSRLRSQAASSSDRRRVGGGCEPKDL